MHMVKTLTNEVRRTLRPTQDLGMPKTPHSRKAPKAGSRSSRVLRVLYRIEFSKS